MLTGAGRLELCSSLMEGGLTPSLGERCPFSADTHFEPSAEHKPECQTFNLCSRWTGLLQVVKQYVKIPVYVMIRPRGGDFLYSDQEVEVMKKDIELMKSHGADGLVLGALNEDGHVDTELCMEFLGNVCWFVFSFLFFCLNVWARIFLQLYPLSVYCSFYSNAVFGNE